MLTTLQQEIENVLKEFPNYWDNNVLLKNVLIEDIRNYKPEILSALLKNPTIKKTYSLDVDGLHIFKVEEFVSMLRYKTYLENSYTKYSNEVGLTSEGKYLKYDSDVFLDFPHKDGVLEGGMTKEESGKEEIYYHNILAKEEIDTLLLPKLLNSIKKYDENGSKSITNIASNDNLILKGNNLIALHTLNERYKDKVKLIYIDPPYNTGGDSFKYNDRFNHSTWLTFMKNRLEIAKDMLTDEGSIWIVLDKNEVFYLKVLMDEIFNRENFVSEIIWKNNEQSKGYGDQISLHHNTILVYRKSEKFKLKLLPRTKKDNKNYSNPDKDAKGDWRASDVRNSAWRPNLQYDITTPSGKIISHPDNGWRFSQETLKKELFEGKIKFNNDETRVIRKIYLSEQEGRVIESVWGTDDVGTTREANKEIKNIFGDNVFSTPKPEKLLQRIIHIGSDENDIVLDFFMGSATTQSVAMKMNRQFIGVEQMNYINTVSVPRLQKVIEGEQGGISKEVDWQGGGSFVYAELFELNQVYINEIQEAVNPEEIEKIIQKIKTSPFLNIKVDIEKLLSKKEAFFDLTLQEQKKLLIQVLDNNQLYLNYSEIDDDQYAIDDQTKAFNRSFYQEEV